MNDVKRILGERVNEINIYYKHLEDIEDGCEEPLFKILKANMFLMLYNVVEAAVSNAINAIRENIYRDEETDFDGLKDEIKMQIIKDLKKNMAPQRFISNCPKISNDIIKITFNIEDISKGNINNDVVRNLSNVYGFTITGSDYSQTAHGTSLNFVKDKRNDLSHGTFSFAEVGKEFSLQDIERYKDQTLKYLDFLLSNIEIYLNQKDYKKGA